MGFQVTSGPRGFPDWKSAAKARSNLREAHEDDVESAMPPRVANLGASSQKTAPNVLRLGNRGKAVDELKAHLARAGFDPGTTPHLYDRATEAAVLAFQRSSVPALEADGIADSATRAALAKASPLELLASAEEPSGGIFAPKTKAAAVWDFRKSDWTA
jgi:peptidoglycan hydrolase-like protein with peptidoglycan-binding domain